MARLSLMAGLPVAVLLLVSAYPHIDNNYHFLGDFLAYGLIRSKAGLVLAAMLPYMQLVLALALLLFDARVRRAAAIYSTAMFLSFVVAQIFAIVRELPIACGCFGDGEGSMIGWRSVSIAVLGLVFSVLSWCFCGMELRRSGQVLPT